MQTMQRDDAITTFSEIWQSIIPEQGETGWLQRVSTQVF